MKKRLYLIAGLLAVALGMIGLALPVMPTVPFFILAAFCFARSNPVLEHKLLSHPHFGPHIHLWRQRRAISRRGKQAATVAFALSILFGFLTLPWPWQLLPMLIALIALSWIWSRPDS